MVNSTVSNGSDIIESDQQKDEESKTKHVYSSEIFERDELWNDFNIVQHVDSNNFNRTSSGVWKFFGKLHYNDRIVDEGYFYCVSCYANRITKKYQTNTSTGNLIKHMIRAHDIVLEQPVYRIKRGSDSYTVIKEEFKGDLSNFMNSNDDEMCYDINDILIAEVHKRPQLYDPKLCHKRKHQIRQNLWFEVYETLNHLIPLARLPKIWKNIRDRYQKVRRSCEKDEGKVPKYRYYEKLRFLDSVIDASMNKGAQSVIKCNEFSIKNTEHESKENCVYLEIEDKNQDELFDVLELDVEDVDNEEVDNENDEMYHDEAIQENVTSIKCETITAIRNSVINECEPDELSNYEFQNTSEMEDSELFSVDHVDNVDNVDNEMADDKPPSPKRAKNDITLSYEGIEPQFQTKSDTVGKSSTLCEFDIFGNYVAAVMKNMKKNDARQLQMKIVQLINSYDEDESV